MHHVNKLIEHQWKKTITGTFMNISMEYLRLQIGTNNKFFQSDYNILIDNETWITNTWSFMSEYDIRVDINPPIRAL